MVNRSKSIILLVRLFLRMMQIDLLSHDQGVMDADAREMQVKC
jgi:hypothetical protein